MKYHFIMRVYYKQIIDCHLTRIECDGFDELKEGIEIYNDSSEPGGRDIIRYIPHNRWNLHTMFAYV